MRPWRTDGTVITTERLILRRARMDDLEDLHRVFSHPLAMRYWDSLPHNDVAQTEHLLNAMVSANPDESDDFIVEFDGQAIGKAGCWCLAEIGFILHPEHWGKGLAHEALCAVIPHTFDTLPIEKIDADVDPRNSTSLRLLSRLGFVETGRASRTFQLGDEWCDSLYLNLKRGWLSVH